MALHTLNSILRNTGVPCQVLPTYESHIIGISSHERGGRNASGPGKVCNCLFLARLEGSNLTLGPCPCAGATPKLPYGGVKGRGKTYQLGIQVSHYWCMCTQHLDTTVYRIGIGDAAAGNLVIWCAAGHACVDSRSCWSEQHLPSGTPRKVGLLWCALCGTRCTCSCSACMCQLAVLKSEMRPSDLAICRHTHHVEALADGVSFVL